MEERDPEERLLTHLNESIIQEDISLPLHFQDNSLVALVLVLYITYIYCKHCTLSSRNKFLFPSIFYLSILIYSYCIVLYIAFYLNFFRKKKKRYSSGKKPLQGGDIHKLFWKQWRRHTFQKDTGSIWVCTLMEWILYCSMLYIERHKWTLIIQWWKRDTKNSHSQCFASKLPKNIPWRAVVFHGLAHCVFCNQATEQSIQSASSWQQHVHVHRTLTGYVFSRVLCGWRSFLILPSGDILFSITLTPKLLL